MFEVFDVRYFGVRSKTTQKQREASNSLTKNKVPKLLLSSILVVALGQSRKSLDVPINL